MSYIWFFVLLIGGIAVWWIYKDVNRGRLLGIDAFTYKYADFIAELSHIPGTQAGNRYQGIYKIDLIEGFYKKYQIRLEDRRMCISILQAINNRIKEDIENKRNDRVLLMSYLVRSERLIDNLQE